MFDNRRLQSRKKYLIAALTVVILIVGGTGVVEGPLANAASISDCAANTQVPGGTLSFAHWTNVKGYTYAAGQHWCAYNNALDRRLVWQSDGNLVAYTGAHTGGVALWASHTSGATGAATTGARLAFQIDGNVVIYNQAGTPIWTTDTYTSTAGDYYLSLERGPNLTDNGGGDIIAMRIKGDTTVRWYQTLEGPITNDGSGATAPEARIVGWKSTMVEDFNETATAAQFQDDYRDSWCGYTDNDAYRNAYSDSTLISAHNGLMDVTLDGTYGGAGVFGPFADCTSSAGTSSSTSTYGRYSIRYEVTGGTNYQFAAQLWPADDNWGEGEMDYAEGNPASTINIYQHALGDDPAVNIGDVHTGAKFQNTWHTSTIEWAPNSYKVYLDGILEFSTTSSVPTTPHVNVLQIPAWNAGTTPGHLYVAWVAQWAKS